MKTRYCIELALMLMPLLTACSNDSAEETTDIVSGTELQGITAAISTRAASAPSNTWDGRTSFRPNDSLVITEFHRNDNPLDCYTYSYKDGKQITFATNDGKSWTKTSKAKVYWTDAVSKHFMTAYSLPTDTFKWEQQDNNYYGEIDTASTIAGNDLLLLHDESQLATGNGAFAALTFHHALARVRVVCNIQGFSTATATNDQKAKVSDLLLLGQPYKYVWDLTSTGVTKASEDTITFKLLNAVPEGTGTADKKVFTFYGLVLPTDGDGRTANMTFKVNYPSALDPTQTVTNNYTTVLRNVKFVAGKTTTINISLNHESEKITTTVSFSDWQSTTEETSGELSM